MVDPGIKERDKRWLEGLCQGDEAAFEALFRAYYEELCRFASKYVSSPDVVEDLIQGIFVSVWKRRQALDPEQSIRSYLYQAARNEAFKHLNRQRVRREHRDQKRAEQHLVQVQEGPEEAFRHQELDDFVEEALSALPERRRHIFILSRRHGLTYAEIAELLDISIKTVETQMGRALRALEKQFAEVLSVFR